MIALECGRLELRRFRKQSLPRNHVVGVDPSVLVAAGGCCRSLPICPSDHAMTPSCKLGVGASVSSVWIGNRIVVIAVNLDVVWLAPRIVIFSGWDSADRLLPQCRFLRRWRDEDNLTWIVSRILGAQHVEQRIVGLAAGP